MDQTLFVIWSCIRIKCKVLHGQNWFMPPSSSPTDHPKVVPLLQFFFVSASVVSGFTSGVCVVLIFPSFGALVGLHFVIVAFPWYLHIFFFHSIELSELAIRNRLSLKEAVCLQKSFFVRCLIYLDQILIQDLSPDRIAPLILHILFLENSVTLILT